MPTTKTVKKHYEVQIVAFATVVVENAENEDKAMEYALDACSMGDLQLDEARVKREIPQDQLANAERNADCVAKDPDAKPFGDEED